MARPCEVTVNVNGRQYTGRRWAEGDVTVTDEAGVMWSLWQAIVCGSDGLRHEPGTPKSCEMIVVFQLVNAALLQLDQQHDAAELAGILAGPTQEELIEEEREESYRRWLRRANDLEGTVSQ